MLILTQPGIESFNPARISSTVVSCFEFCMADVNDDFNPTEEEMEAAGIMFWWQITRSQLRADFYKLRKYKGGIVEGILDQLNVSKEINIAYGIYAIADVRQADEWQVWERSILKEGPNNG
jgi:hypothetical protein